MFKPKASLQVTAGERVYQIICEHDSPLTEVIEVLKQVLSGVEKMLDEALKKQDEKPDDVVESIQEAEVVEV